MKEITYANGDSFTGEFKDGKFHGIGQYKWSREKQSYRGEFRHGLRSGQGTQLYPDGAKYTGMFVNDNMHTTSMEKVKGNIKKLREFAVSKLNEPFDAASDTLKSFH